MKTRLATVVVIGLLSCRGGIAKDQTKETVESQEASYVKVEIKGKLEKQGSIETDWISADRRGATGLRIMAPGKRDINLPLTAQMQNKVGMHEPAGISWQLFVGDDRELRAAAERLVGKCIVAKGIVTVISDVNRSGPLRPGRVVVRVSSLQPAKVK